MRVSDSLVRLRWQSALLMLVFLGVAIFLPAWLADRDYRGWATFALLLSTVGATAGLFLLYSALFRARQAEGAVCFVPGSWMAKITEQNDEFCPIFYKTAMLSFLVYVALAFVFAVLYICIALLAAAHQSTGIQYWLLVPAALAFLLLLWVKRKTKVVEKGLLGVLMLVSLLGLGTGVLHVPELAREAYGAGWSGVGDFTLGLMIIGAIALLGYIAFNWERIEKTWLGRLLAPLKRRTCIKLTVCKAK